MMRSQNKLFSMDSPIKSPLLSGIMPGGGQVKLGQSCSTQSGWQKPGLYWDIMF